MRDRLLILVRWCRAALSLLVAVVEGRKPNDRQQEEVPALFVSEEAVVALHADNLTSERRFLPSMISTGSYVELQVRKKVGSARREGTSRGKKSE